jgi:hypothetical protein
VITGDLSLGPDLSVFVPTSYSVAATLAPSASQSILILSAASILSLVGAKAPLHLKTNDCLSISKSVSTLLGVRMTSWRSSKVPDVQSKSKPAPYTCYILC